MAAGLTFPDPDPNERRHRRDHRLRSEHHTRRSPRGTPRRATFSPPSTGPSAAHAPGQVPAVHGQMPVPVRVPVELPRVVMVVDATGVMQVTVNGAAYLPPNFAPAWTRASFPTIIDALLASWGCPLRVEVHESDGTTFTDIITPRPTRTIRESTSGPFAAGSAPAQVSSQMAVPPVPAVAPVLVEVTGAGFLPGEDVAVAVILTHADATTGTVGDRTGEAAGGIGGGGGGVVRALLTAGQLAAGSTGEVLLLGRVSGTVCIAHPGRIAHPGDAHRPGGGTHTDGSAR